MISSTENVFWKQSLIEGAIFNFFFKMFGGSPNFLIWECNAIALFIKNNL